MPSVTGKKIFGAGRFFGVNNVTSPTPMRALVPQDISVDFKLSTKELHGESRLPVSVANGDLSVTGKVTMGANNARMFADLIFGGISTSAGQINQADKEAGTITAGAVTVSNSATATTDLGLTKTDGTPFIRVASAPAVGQYSYAAGVYTFNVGDNGTAVLISYLYTVASTGEKMTLVNSLQGPAGAFTAVCVFPYGTEQDVLTLNNAIAQDASIASKQGDYAKPTFGFMAATDNNDVLGSFSFAEAA